MDISWALSFCFANHGIFMVFNGTITKHNFMEENKMKKLLTVATISSAAMTAIHGACAVKYLFIDTQMVYGIYYVIATAILAASTIWIYKTRKEEKRA